MEAISAAVEELAEHSVRVLSPSDPRVVAQHGEFLFVASDVVRSVRLVQDRHLESIRAADFLWLVCPDGYVGQSASMEVGFAAAVNVPIFSTHAPTDLTLRQYVKVIPTLLEALRMMKASSRSGCHESVLINPRASVEDAHRIIEQIGVALTCAHGSGDPAHLVYGGVADLRRKFVLPTYMHND
jgi:hypothetical protein